MQTLYSRITGKLLGHGNIKRTNNKGFYFQFIHSKEDACWANYCYSQLKNFIPLQEPLYERRKDSRSKKGYTEHYIVRSLTNATIRQLYDEWYQNKKKTVPAHLIATYMNEEALAWWYQDNGYLKKKKDGSPEKVVLSTSHFNQEELHVMSHLLNRIFGLQFTIDSQKRLILSSTLQINYFLSLVYKWIQPCMYSKMKTSSHKKKIAKRTTIHLSEHYKIKRPTETIHQVFRRHASAIQPTKENFRRWIQERNEPKRTKRYQIQLQEEVKETLQQKEAITGLTMSELIEETFRQEELHKPHVIRLEDDLSYVQKSVLVGSIMADAMLSHDPTKTYGVRSNYHEHFSIQQIRYRKWKHRILSPHTLFIRENTTLITKYHPLFKSWEAKFYDEQRIKRIPFDLLKKYCNPFTLATIYLDDGSLMISQHINNNQKKIYLTPHIALYLQNFKKEELEQLAKLLKNIFNLSLKVTRQPYGQGYYLRTSKVKDTLQFLKTIQIATKNCPSMAYKTNWEYRLYIEKKRLTKKFPQYEVLASSSERKRLYSQKEIETMIQMKKSGATDKEIAQAIGRTYWAIVYKLSELRKQKKI